MSIGAIALGVARCTGRVAAAGGGWAVSTAAFGGITVAGAYFHFQAVDTKRISITKKQYAHILWSRLSLWLGLSTALSCTLTLGVGARLGLLSARFSLYTLLDALKFAADGMAGSGAVITALIVSSQKDTIDPKNPNTEDLNKRGVLCLFIGFAYFGARGARGLAETISPGCTLRPLLAIWQAIRP